MILPTRARVRATIAMPIAALALTLTACGSDEPGGATAQDSTSPGPQALGTDVLLTDDETVYSEGADWFRTDAYEGDGQDVFNPCARSAIAGLGADSVVRSDMELRNTEQPDVEVGGDWATQVVGQFPDATSAQTAYDQISTWITNCAERSTKKIEYRTHKPIKVTIDGATSEVFMTQYGPVDPSVDPYGDSGYFMETGIAVTGGRLTVLTTAIIGQDYNFLDGTPVEQMMGPAVKRVR